MIDFADNEGCLDYEVAKNLFEDFEQWKLDAEKYLSEYELEIYKKWKQICKDASNNGVFKATSYRANKEVLEYV